MKIMGVTVDLHEGSGGWYLADTMKLALCRRRTAEIFKLDLRETGLYVEVADYPQGKGWKRFNLLRTVETIGGNPRTVCWELSFGRKKTATTWHASDWLMENFPKSKSIWVRMTPI